MAREVMRGETPSSPSNRTIYNDQGQKINLSAYCEAAIIGLRLNDVIFGRLFVLRHPTDSEFSALPPGLRSPRPLVAETYDEVTQRFFLTSETEQTEEATHRAATQALDAALEDGISPNHPQADPQEEHNDFNNDFTDLHRNNAARQRMSSRFERTTPTPGFSENNESSSARQRMLSRFERTTPTPGFSENNESSSARQRMLSRFERTTRTPGFSR